MEGDVAYVDILGFRAKPEQVRQETSRIMSAAADAKALIIDLRENGGGSPYTVALVSSYLFGAEPVQVTSLYFRRDDRMEDFFTNPLVAGTRFGPDKPVYVLTSSRTFSAGRSLRQPAKRKRATNWRDNGRAQTRPRVLMPHNLNLFARSRGNQSDRKTNRTALGSSPTLKRPPLTPSKSPTVWRQNRARGRHPQDRSRPDSALVQYFGVDRSNFSANDI
jgi:hypothetical protein